MNNIITVKMENRNFNPPIPIEEIDNFLTTNEDVKELINSNNFYIIISDRKNNYNLPNVYDVLFKYTDIVGRYFRHYIENDTLYIEFKRFKTNTKYSFIMDDLEKNPNDYYLCARGMGETDPETHKMTIKRITALVLRKKDLSI